MGNAKPKTSLKVSTELILIMLKESSTSAITECLPCMVPKSCEKPAMPKLSSLGSYEMQHVSSTDEIRTRDGSS
jgi:hypothetical protein